jgi:hypothetical protein
MEELEMIKNLICTMMLTAFTIVLSAEAAFGDESRVFPTPPPINEGETIFNSSRFQSGIKSGMNLGIVAKENSLAGDQATSFGFAEKSEEAKFFLVGSLFSEVLAYLRGGNIEMAAKRLETIEREFINLQAPSSLYNYISRTRNFIELKEYSPETTGEFLSLFQPLFEDYARSRGSDMLTLFRAGSWLFDITLTAAAGDKLLLIQPERLGYFIKEMKRMDAPVGVMNALDEIDKIMGKKEIADKDIDDVLELVKKIQIILG